MARHWAPSDESESLLSSGPRKASTSPADTASRILSARERPAAARLACVDMLFANTCLDDESFEDDSCAGPRVATVAGDRARRGPPSLGAAVAWPSCSESNAGFEERRYLGGGTRIVFPRGPAHQPASCSGARKLLRPTTSVLAAPARHRRDTRHARQAYSRTEPSGRPESGGGPQTLRRLCFGAIVKLGILLKPALSSRNHLTDKTAHQRPQTARQAPPTRAEHHTVVLENNAPAKTTDNRTQHKNTAQNHSTMSGFHDFSHLPRQHARDEAGPEAHQ